MIAVREARMVLPLIDCLGVRPKVRHGRRVTAAVVVQDDDHPTTAVAEVVQRLEGEAAGHRPVADDRHDVASIDGARVARHREAIGIGQHG